MTALPYRDHHLVGLPAVDDELPDYEPATTPEYSEYCEYNAGHTPTPLYTYHLRQMDRRHQLFVPYGPSASWSYRVAARSARLFSKKAETNIWRIAPRRTTEEHMCGIWFDNDGPLPWCPRAHFNYKTERGSSMHAMESRNFSDWSIAVGRSKLLWVLEGHPRYRMVLRRQLSDEVVARFNFSSNGTAALGGAEAGDLSIYRNALTLSDQDAGDDVVEMVLCALVVALANFRKMGKYHKNVEGGVLQAETMIVGVRG